MAKLKKGLQVIVRKGKDKGKTGEIVRVITKTTRTGTDASKVIVQGVNVVQKHVKPNPNLNVAGGIFAVERPISVANIVVATESKAKKEATKSTTKKTTKKTAKVKAEAETE